MKNNIFEILVCTICISLLSGCTAIKTITDTTENIIGIPYYLPKSLVKVTVTKQPINGKDTYKIDVQPIHIPDTKSRFVLQHQENPLASDRLCVARTETGLLESIQFATDDKTDEILVKLAELAAKIGKAGFVEDAENTAIVIGDPEQPTKIVNQIKKVFKDVDNIEFSGLVRSTTTRTCPKESICFSTLTTVPVLLTVKEGSSFQVDATTVNLVDLNHVGELKIDRPFLVEKITKLGFEKGVLTSMAYKQPSEALALVSLPLDMLDAVMAVPADFFSTALKGAFSDQKAILEQQKDIAGLQKDIRVAEKDKQPTTNGKSIKLECVSLIEED